MVTREIRAIGFTNNIDNLIFKGSILGETTSCSPLTVSLKRFFLWGSWKALLFYGGFKCRSRIFPHPWVMHWSRTFAKAVPQTTLPHAFLTLPYFDIFFSPKRLLVKKSVIFLGTTFCVGLHIMLVYCLTSHMTGTNIWKRFTSIM